MEWSYDAEPDIEGGYYHEEAHQQRRRKRFAAEALYSAGKWVAKKAARTVLQAAWDKMAGKRKSAQYVEAQKKAKIATGASKGRSGNDSGIKPAMFMKGRGAEIPLVLSNFQKPISLTLGLKSPRLKDPRMALAKSFSYQSKSVSTGFAFKAVKAYEFPKIALPVGDELNKNSRYQPDNTFITTHVYRHKDPRGMSPSMGDNSNLWNFTLGPDAAFARRKPDSAGGSGALGTAIEEPDGYDKSLKTAERFPTTQRDCIPRYSVDANEQNSWNLNPCKTIGVDFETPVTALQYIAPPGPVPVGPPAEYAYVPRAQPMYTFANSQPPPIPLGQPVSGTEQQYGPQIFQSIPASQTTGRSAAWYSTPSTGADNQGNVQVQVGAPDGYYKVQSGQGSLTYNFSNNGTVPIVVDVVVTNLKKGKVIYDSANFNKKANTSGVYENQRNAYSKALFEQVSKGYVNAHQGADSCSVFGGQGIEDQTPISDMKHEFLPEKYFKLGIAKSQPTPGDPAAIPVLPFPALPDPTYAGVPGPQFNFIARDQFIIAPGANKPWRTTLPAMDYDARKYRSFDADGIYDLATTTDPAGPVDADANKPFLNRVVYDDRAIAVSFRFSNVAVPIAEVSSTSTAGEIAVIERGAAGLNVSCNGTYVEHPHPVYKVKANPTMYAQGVTAQPYYTTDTPQNVKLGQVDIVNSTHSVRFADESSAYVQVGPTNSQPA